MGYRNYLYIEDKKKLNKIRKMNKEELFALVGEIPDNEEEDYYPYWSDVLEKADGQEAIELGKKVAAGLRCEKIHLNRALRAEKKLEIAVKALRIYANLRYDGTVTGYETIAKEALKEIKG